MEPRSLDGIAAFIRRVRAAGEPRREDDALAPATPAVAQPPDTGASGSDPEPPASLEPAPDLWASPPELDGPLYSQYAESGEDRAASDADWRLAEEALASGAAQEATVVGWNRGGLLVHWRGLQGFLPASQLQRMIRYTTDAERDAAFAGRVGEALTLKVIEVDRGRTRLVFSERALQWGAGDAQSLWQEIQAGQVRRGRVRNLCDFGAFIDLGGVDGLIHISELSWRHVRHPSDALEIGQEVDVYVMSVEPTRKRVALSLKRLMADPWEAIAQRYTPGMIVQGVVTNVLSFGAFARIEDGVEGLIHISELAEGSFLHPRNVINEGDTVTVRVMSIDSATRRLALSLRQARKADEPEHANGSAPAPAPGVGQADVEGAERS